MDAPKFQAYLKQQLIFEHQRLRLERSRRNWRVTAVAAMAACALAVARPGLPGRSRDSMATLLGSSPAATAAHFAGVDESVPLDRALAASLEQDWALAKRMGARHIYGTPVPEQTYVVSRFPISGGRAVSIYTPLIATPEDQGSNISYASEGGIW